MKKALFFLFFITITTTLFAQIKFEKGYFINNNGERTECLIYNQDWRLNPDGFDYKLTENEKVTSAKITEIKEFGVYDFSKYIRFDGNVDTSNYAIDKLTENKNAEFKQVSIFLKTIVEGNANFYMHIDKQFTRYFYDIPNKKIEQLINKEYIKYNENGAKQIATNLEFQRQLLRDLTCETTGIDEVKALNYTVSSLKRFFIDYNKCNSGDFKLFSSNKINYNLALKTGYSAVMLKFDHPLVEGEFENFYFRYGIENEIRLPFNNGKWSAIVEPTYQKMKEQGSFLEKRGFGPYNISFDYQSIELPVGLRYYMFLNEDSKLFVNAFLVQDFAFNSFYYLNKARFAIKPSLSGQLGFGYKFREIANVELQISSPKKLARTITFFNTNYYHVGLKVGFYIL